MINAAEAGKISDANQNELDEANIAGLVDDITARVKSTVEEPQHNTVTRSIENIASAAIWTGKKRYCMLIHDSEKE